MMNEIVTVIATACFGLAAGIFTVLSLIEKPIWPLMRDPSSKRATDKEVRLIHAQLKRVIYLLPPIMKTNMGLAAILLIVQAWLRMFDGASVGAIAIFITFMGYLLWYLESRIRAVADVPSESSIDIVRKGLAQLSALHHVGLAMAATMLIVQLFVAINSVGILLG